MPARLRPGRVRAEINCHDWDLHSLGRTDPDPAHPPRIQTRPAPFVEAPVERDVPLATRLWSQDWLRRLVIIAAIALLWELAARWQGNPLLLATFADPARVFVDGLCHGILLERAGISLVVLLQGYLAGIVLAFGLTTLAVSTRLGRDLLSTLTAKFNPLPAIALLPLALMWFGLEQASLIFVLIHLVLWSLALNIFSGFQAVPETLRMAGRNYGLTGWRLVLQILAHAALPSVVSGLKIGWAFAWRMLIAAELVFGASCNPGPAVRSAGADQHRLGQG
ncbi:ABC transporter permease [Paracoccus benzoatiresistens]|uniref:ABC transporter permease subunit n=1 Tax=Paracoccus benzoatiresistens TaxID=2997341 RepID=A0ABT4J9C6_9RHOB|nr:ABC transporter permease subunit [Paracoccus sp. EF6]MCZ0963727.1 ABC transporter permease subunit [Paracoccus sp. EF6]